MTRLKKRRRDDSSLENPLLFRQFVRYVEKLNPDIELDKEIIDTSLEWDEALAALKRIYPDLQTAKSEDLPEIKQLREFLSEFGIDNKHIQNLIIADPKPYSEEELAAVSYALNNRSMRAKLLDFVLKAPTTRDVRKWARHPNRYDIVGYDNPGARRR